MRKVFSVLAIMGFSLMIACKGKPNDTELQTKVAEMVKVPGVVSEVKEGTVTLSGTVTDEASKTAAESAARAVEGIKGVTNNIAVVAPVVPEPVINISPDDAMSTQVATAVKDFPGIAATVKDGVISVAGELKKDQWKTLKMALDALGPKKVDASGLKLK
jgi:hyperosmotically inducible protein